MFGGSIYKHQKAQITFFVYIKAFELLKCSYLFLNKLSSARCKQRIPNEILSLRKYLKKFSFGKINKLSFIKCLI